MRPLRTRQVFLPVFTAVVVLLVFGSIARVVGFLADERARQGQLQQLSDLRGKLESELNAAINLTAGLAAYITVHGEIEPEVFHQLAEQLLADGPLLINITLAPNNRIRDVHPLEPNRAALGIDLGIHPAQGPSVHRAMRERRPVLAGPVTLVQGGQAIIHRTPIFLDGAEGRRHYWGLVSVPIDYTALLERAGLAQLSERMPLAIRGLDGMGARGAPFFGDPKLFNDPGNLFMDIRALDGGWQIASAPQPDSSAELRTTLTAIYLNGILMAALMAWFVWRIQMQSRQVADSERLYRELTTNMQDVVFQVDEERRVRYLNPAFQQLTGIPCQEAIGCDWLELLEPNDQPEARSAYVALLCEPEKGPLLGEYRLLRFEGEPLWVMLRADVHRDEEGRVRGSIGTMVDITERREAEQQIRHLAMHDALTGLPNRRLLNDRFTQALARGRRQGVQLALMFLDLDGFKLINDVYGHEIGDKVLQEVAVRLRQQLRDPDTLARVGGDEFVVLLEDLRKDIEAGPVADKLIEAIRVPLVIDGQSFSLGLSVGITFYPDHAEDLDQLIHYADMAMYLAKQSGKGAWRIFSPALAG